MTNFGSVSVREKIFYGTGNLGYSLAIQTQQLFLMMFGTVTLGVSGTLMGLVLSIGIFWDAITDPIIGYLSDMQTSYKFGKRHGYIAVGFVGMAVFNLLIWTIPGMGFVTQQWHAFIILLLCKLGFETFNTMIATPYTALGTELTEDYDEKTNIQAYKTSFFLLGFVFPTVLIATILDPLNHSLQAYSIMAVIVSIFSLIVGAIFFFGTYSTLPRLRKRVEVMNGEILVKPDKKSLLTKFKRLMAKLNYYEKIKNRNEEKYKKEPREKPIEIFKTFFTTIKRKNYSSLVIAYAISLISTAFISILGVHIFNFGFGFTGFQQGASLGALIIGTIISQPFWAKQSRKIGKRNSIILALSLTIAAVVLFTLTFFLRGYIGNAFIFVPIVMFLAGFGTGALYSVPISMFGDLMIVEAAETKKDKTGRYSGFMTLAQKIANAFAALVIGISLDIIGFDATRAESGNIQEVSTSVQNGIGLIAVTGIFVSLIAAIFIYLKYDLKKEDVLAAEKKIIESGIELDLTKVEK